MNTLLSTLTSCRLALRSRASLNLRLLYSVNSLGVEYYVRNRERFLTKAEMMDKFREKMKNYCYSDDPASMIFTEDLKRFVHLTSCSEDDLRLVEEMMKKYHKQNAELRFGNFLFGPVVMRMYHHFNLPDEALRIFNLPELDGFFDQLSACVVLLDLLFINEKYEEVIELYRQIREKQLNFGKYPKSLMIIVFAACYKINTEEMFRYTLSLWKDMCDIGHTPLRRAACFTAALAMKHNSPHVGLEVIAGISNQNFVLIRSIKVCCYCALRRVDDAVTLLTSVLTFDSQNIPKQTFPRDVIQTVQEAVEKYDNKELSFEFSRIAKQLLEQNHVSPKTLDDLMLSDVSITNPVNRNQSVLQAAFNGPENVFPNRRNSNNMYRRPGLTDLY